MTRHTKMNYKKTHVRMLLSCDLFTMLIFLHTVWLLVNIGSAEEMQLVTGRPLQHLAINPSNGEVFVAGVNRIFRLHSNLTIRQGVVTGPVQDSPQCLTPITLNQCSSASSTDNYNKILLIYPSRGTLIQCGSIYQGGCYIHPLDEITSSQSYLDYDVAANSAEGSSVGFIAPGPSSMGDPDIFYVASSFVPHTVSAATTIRDGVPAISSRKLGADEEFSYMYKNSLTKAGSFVKFINRNDKKPSTTYVTGFSLDTYIYFIFLQKEKGKTAPISKILQLCKDDKNYHSYIEMRLKCTKNSVDFPLLRTAVLSKTGSLLATSLSARTDDPVIYALFSNSTSPISDSALCIYKMSDIRTAFQRNLEQCNLGNGGRVDTLKSLKGTGCSSGSTNTCIGGSVSPLNGTISATSEAVYNWTGAGGSALQITTVQDDTVVFIGTTNGQLKKMIVNSRFETTEYRTDSIQTGSPIKQDMKLDKQQKNLFILTDDKVHKVSVQDCGQYSDCPSCKAANDPYCGWCTLEKRCTTKTDCGQSDLNQRWLSRKSSDCFNLKEISPLQANLERSIDVVVKLSLLPALGPGKEYQCKFGEITVKATESTNQLQCQTPPADRFPALSHGKDFFNQTLKISSTESSVVLFRDIFTFYKCSVHKSCSPCALTAWGCDWCIHEDRCSDQSRQCQGDKVYGLKTIHNVAVGDRGPNFCPQLSEQSTKIILPVGVATSFPLAGRNLPQPLNDTPSQLNYQCHLYQASQKIGFGSATWLSETSLECNGRTWSYPDKAKEIKVDVKVTWNSDFRVEDPYGANVTLYKCHEMGPDCSTCLSLDIHKLKYRCKYCGGNCSFRDQCKVQPTLDCPKHTITKVYPMNATLDGRNRVTIEGTNLGKGVEDVHEGVTLAGVRCTVINDLYQVSKKIVCEVGQTSKIQQGPVVVTIANYEVQWYTFSYRDPRVYSVFPVKGPIAGGTKIIINGTQLMTGARDNMMAKIGNIDCLITSISDTVIICRTREFSKPSRLQFKMQFDGHATRGNNLMFSYTNNPNVTGINPLKSFRSGGKPITVKGLYLDAVLEPKMYYTSGDKSSTKQVCKIVSDTELLCPSPSTTSFRRRRRQLFDNDVKIGLEMDGVQSVQDIETHFPGVAAVIEIYDDPILKEFKHGKKVYRSQQEGPNDVHLVLEGDNLDSGAGLADYNVTIGQQVCKVDSVSKTRLLCVPPKSQPPGEGANSLPVVQVKVGANLKFKLGLLEYETESTLPLPAIIGIAAAGAVLLFVIVIILIMYHRRATKAERQYKKIQKQLDDLESSVRQECKQAFAELQTDMSDLTSDLTATGIPFWDYSQYTFKVLFPSLTDHPVLHADPQNTTSQYGSLDPGVAQFSQLLNNKQFLLIFIRTLEARKEFSIRDRSVVASLLMIVLQDKMEYATEILKALLNELIDRSVEKKNPKLMLRRTESVVEKFLTNWLSLSLYSYIRKNAGRSLFLLYKALKHQTEKGPVDAITSESRYSLSEDKLLREKINPHTLIINVSAEADHEPVQCRVLDCDTITQAKEKMLDAIYKNTPFCRRPSVYDVDLEWRSGRSGHLPLQDDDVTTDLKTGWKRVNTLAHYHVPDGASMALVLRPKSAEHDGVRNVNGMVELTGTTLSSVTPIITMEEGTKVWHLVKHDDNQNSRTTKVISEIFLTRLLSTKGTLQKFIDDLFTSMLKVGPDFPLPIKYLFDFLDQAARRHNIVDTDVVHTWKSNSLPLRFWVNLIKNPDFLLDVNKPHIVDSCLSVIAQTLMDSCSVTDHKLGKDSPSNKLLFAKDIPRYKSWILQCYKGIQELPVVTDGEINKLMTEVSKNFTTDLNVSVALRQLFKYAHQYRFELLETLDEDPSAQRLHLRERFEQVNSAMNRPPATEPYPEITAML